MTARPRVGTLFAPGRAIGELAEFAQQVEALGFDELWLAEDSGMYGAITAAATALGTTQRLRVGIGLLPASLRNPMVAAMEVSTLAQLHPHRLTVAFGHGVEAWMRDVGARPPNRILALEECVTAVRGLLHGDAVRLPGAPEHSQVVTLGHPPDTAPTVLIGSTGTRAIELARTKADGLLIPEGAGEAAVSWASQLLGNHRSLTVYAWLLVADAPERALSDVLPSLREWRDWGLYPNLFAHWGIGEDDPIDEAVAGRVAVAGTADQCAESVEGLGAAGAECVVFLPVGDPLDQLARFASVIRTGSD